MHLRGLNILGVLVAVWFFSLCHSVANETASDSIASRKALYSPDPNHLWNRLHRGLLVESLVDGNNLRFLTIIQVSWDPLLEGTSHENAVKVLDEFLSTHGENLISDPVKRAILQSDLWAEFDGIAGPADNQSPKSEARLALQNRLAKAIQRLALTPEQIDALPDNYAEAAKSHEFGKEYNNRARIEALLPPDLFSTNGPGCVSELTCSKGLRPCMSHMPMAGLRFWCS